MWARLIKRLLVVGVVGSLSVVLFARWAIKQSQKVPEFYQQAIAAAPPENLAENSRQLERRVEQLHAEVAQVGSWSASFDADQINAWLAAQLPERFPSVQAKGLQDPRVMISEGKLTVAARFTNQRFDAVLSCDLAAQLTDQPNRLAIRIDNLRAGALPLPISQFEDLIARAAARVHVDVTWEQDEEGAVAFVELAEADPVDVESTAAPESTAKVDQAVVRQDPPADQAEAAETFTVELIELRDDQLIVAGQSGDAAHQVFTPRGPVYSIAGVSDEPPSAVTLSSRNVQSEDLGPDASAH